MVIAGNRRLVAALAALVLSGCAEQTSESTIPNIPTVETRGMEAPVRILIDAVARNLEGDRHSAIAWGRLGRVYHAHELYTPALVCYEQAIRLDQDDYQWPYLAAHAASQVDKDAAVALFEQARERAPRHATVLVAQGELLRQLGRSDDAREALLAALEADDRSSFARVGLARVALVEGDLPRARSLLERAAELTPTDGSIYPCSPGSMHGSASPIWPYAPNGSPRSTTRRWHPATRRSTQCEDSPRTRTRWPRLGRPSPHAANYAQPRRSSARCSRSVRAHPRTSAISPPCCHAKVGTPRRWNSSPGASPGAPTTSSC